MSITITGQDTLQKFIFDNAAARGELIDISATWREVLSRHEYPVAVKKLLGQMTAARGAAVGEPEVQRFDHHADSW